MSLHYCTPSLVHCRPVTLPSQAARIPNHAVQRLREVLVLPPPAKVLQKHQVLPNLGNSCLLSWTTRHITTHLGESMLCTESAALTSNSYKGTALPQTTFPTAFLWTSLNNQDPSSVSTPILRPSHQARNWKERAGNQQCQESFASIYERENHLHNYTPTNKGSSSQRGAQRHTASHKLFKASSWKTVHVHILPIDAISLAQMLSLIPNQRLSDVTSLWRSSKSDLFHFISPKPGYRRLGMTLHLHKNWWGCLRASLPKLTKNSNFSQVTNPCPTKYRIGTHWFEQICFQEKMNGQVRPPESWRIWRFHADGKQKILKKLFLDLLISLEALRKRRLDSKSFVSRTSCKKICSTGYWWEG